MILIQARLNSKRFPSKIKKEFQGKPILARVIESCLSTPEHHTIICLPISEKNNPFYEEIASKFPSVRLFWGDENNVLARFSRGYLENRALLQDEPDNLGIIRVCADRPLLSPKLLRSLTHDGSGRLEILYNHIGLLTPGPRGLGAESVSRDLAELLFVPQAENSWGHTEHVTANLYSNPEVIARLAVPEELSAHWNKLAEEAFDIDYPEDIGRVEKIASLDSVHEIRKLDV